MHFYDFDANSTTSQSSSLSWYLFVRLCDLSLNFRLPKISRNCHLGFGRKTVNSEGYSELRDPIETRSGELRNGHYKFGGGWSVLVRILPFALIF